MSILKEFVLPLRPQGIREQQLGESHPAVAIGLNNLAGLYKDQRRYEEAEPLYARAVGILEQTLGDKHPNTRVGRSNYADLLRELDRIEEARMLEAKNEESDEQKLER